MSNKRSFSQRSERFGFDSDNPWAFDALRLVCNVPRVYPELLKAWDTQFPGAATNITRLGEAGFLDFQSAVVANTVTGALANRTTRPSTRYRLLPKGVDELRKWGEDIRLFERDFPYAKSENAPVIFDFISCFNLSGSQRLVGMSISGAVTLSGLDESLAKWWVKRLCTLKLMSVRPDKVADVQQVVPEHWRINNKLRRQLVDVLAHYETNWGHLVPVLQPKRRTAILEDVDPGKITLTGASNFAHDVKAADIAALLVASPSFDKQGFFRVEGMHNLSVNTNTYPWEFVEEGTNTTGYQPDIELRAVEPDGTQRLVAVEYERYQNRADGWAHMEKFLGWAHLNNSPETIHDCLFVVDTVKRRESYDYLKSCFADWASCNPELVPEGTLRIGVATEADLNGSKDPLHYESWYRDEITQTSAKKRQPVIYKTKTKGGGKKPYSPFNDYDL